MHNILPTVRIKDPANGFIIINESDFDQKIHTLFDEVLKKDKPKPVAAAVEVEVSDKDVK